MTFTFEEGNFGAAASVANRRLFRLRYASEESRSKAIALSLAKRQYPRGNASGHLEQLACLFDWSRRNHYWHGGLHVKACRSWMLPVAYDPELHTVTQATTSEADCSGKAVHAVWLGFSREGGTPLALPFGSEYDRWLGHDNQHCVYAVTVARGWLLCVADSAAAFHKLARATRDLRSHAAMQPASSQRVFWPHLPVLHGLSSCGRLLAVTRPAPLALRQPGLLRGHYPVRFSAPAIAFLARDTLQPACILTAA